jgi:hypothetical protein
VSPIITASDAGNPSFLSGHANKPRVRLAALDIVAASGTLSKER